MPTIPQFLVEEQLAGRSGFPSLAPSARVFKESDVPLAAGSVLGESIAGLGKDISKAGEFVATGEELRARTEYADRLLVAQGRVLDRLPILNTELEKQRQDPNYATFADRMLAEGKRIIDEGGFGLDPKARQVYDRSMQEKLVMLHQQALGEQSGRREEVARQTTERKFLAAEDAYVNARSDADRAMVLADMQEFATTMTQSGVVRGAEVQRRIGQMERNVSVSRARIRMRNDPQGMLRYLYSVNQGGQQTPDEPPLQPDQVPALIDEATAMQDRIVARAEHNERLGEYRAAKAGQERTTFYRSQLPVDATPEAAATIRNLLQLANTPEEIRALGPAGHQEVVGLLRGALNVAQSTRAERDNTEVETKLRVDIQTAQRPVDLDRAERDFYRMAPNNLKPETQTTLLNILKDRRDAQSPSNRVKYREGVEHIQRAEVVPIESARNPANAAYQQRLMTARLRSALDQYDRDYRAQMTQEGINVADLNALNLADRARTMYFPPAFDDLPLELREAKTPEAARFHLHKLAQQGAPAYSLQAWERIWLAKQQAPVQQEEGQTKLGAPVVPTRPKSEAPLGGN